MTAQCFQWLRFKVESEEVRVREFTDKKGIARVYREQPATVFCCVKDSDDMKPRAIYVPLDADQKPYSPGDYTLSRRSFYVDYNHFGKLAVIPRLVPVPSRFLAFVDGLDSFVTLEDGDSPRSGGIRI